MQSHIEIYVFIKVATGQCVKDQLEEETMKQRTKKGQQTEHCLFL